MSLIECQAVSYAYQRGQPALAGIDLQITAGEWLLVAGDNGSGKSTLCRLFNGLIPHVHTGTLSGQISVCGHDTQQHGPRELFQLVGWVGQQHSAACFNRSVAHELAWSLQCAGAERASIPQQVRRWAATWQITPLLDHPPHALACGQRALVALAAATITAPPILVLDEPLAHLDAAASTLCLAQLATLQRAGTAIICAEHHVHAIAAYATRMLVLDHGRLCADGDPRQLTRDSRFAWASAQVPAPHVPAPTSAPVLHWRGVSFARQQRPILHAVDLAAHTDEIVVLQGENGAGKSTLLQLGIGWLRPQQGQMLLSGQPFGRRSVGQLGRHISLVPQQARQLFARATTRAEIELSARYQRRLDPAWISQLSAQLGLAELLERSPHQLSGGQQRRVAIAAALAHRPQVVLLDEPTSGLDWPGKAALRQLIAACRAHASTYVIATHDHAWAAQLTARRLMLADGQIHAPLQAGARR